MLEVLDQQTIWMSDSVAGTVRNFESWLDDRCACGNHVRNSAFNIGGKNCRVRLRRLKKSLLAEFAPIKREDKERTDGNHMQSGIGNIDVLVERCFRQRFVEADSPGKVQHNRKRSCEDPWARQRR